MPASIVPQIRVVGPPFRKAELIVRLIPVQEDNTVMPKAAAGFSERYLFCSISQHFLFSERTSSTSSFCDILSLSERLASRAAS